VARAAARGPAPGVLAAALSVLAAGAASLAAAAGSSLAVEDDARVAAALIVALPADRATDVVLVDQPGVPDAPRVRSATRVAAAPAAIKDLLLDPAHYRALIPALIRGDLEPPNGGPPVVDWELEVPLFNLSGRMALVNRPDGVTFQLLDGDFAPGRLIFTVTANSGGGTTLFLDALLDVKRSSWLLRRIIKRSPAGEPAVLAAAAYVALRAVALRAEHPGARFALRPGAPPAPPPDWSPDPRPLLADAAAPLRARGVVALVARAPTERLAGVAAAIELRAPVPAVATRLRDPAAWRAFPGWAKVVRTTPGPVGPGAVVEDDLPLVDCDATWTAVAGDSPRWVATTGATHGARLGWTVGPAPGGAAAVAALSLYPRIEATGTVGRRFVSAEPLLEQGLALALAFADVAGVKAAPVTPR
jgi:hypothetical protein